MGYPAERPRTWARWWIATWAVIAATLVALTFVLSFRQWAVAATIGFGLPEGFAVLRHRDPYPPLTHVMRYYLPEWLAFAAIFGTVGAVGAHWFGFTHPLRLGGFAALIGWLIAHFTTVYDQIRGNR